MEKKKFKIGIVKFTDHASLNRIEEGVKQNLDRLGAKHGIELNYNGLVFDGKADTQVMKEIGQRLAAEKVDLVVSISTPPTVAMKDILAENKIKMVFYAVSDPVSAGVINSFEHPGDFVTGISDALDGKKLAKVMLAVIPDIKKVGLLYNTAEISSKMPIREVKEYLSDAGVEMIEATPTCKAEVKQAAEELISKGVQAVVTPTDNTIMSDETELSPLFTRAGIPQFTGSHAFTVVGAFLGLGGYYKDGDASFVNIVESILVKNISPNDIPVVRGRHNFVAVNNQICDALGYDKEKLEQIFTNLGMDTMFLDTQKQIGTDSDL